MSCLSISQLVSFLPTNNFHNLSSHSFTELENWILSRGLSFRPLPRRITHHQLFSSLDKTVNSLRWREYFFKQGAPPLPPPTKAKPFNTSSASTCKRQSFIEPFITLLSHQLSAAFNSIPPPLTNSFQLDLNRLRRLAKNGNIIFKTADKNLGLVAVDRNWYIAQAKTHLLDPSTFRLAFSGNSSPELRTLFEDNLRTRLTLMLRQFCQRYRFEAERFIPQTFSIPSIYFIPKIHKDPVSTRPIVAGHSWIFQPLAIWLVPHLQQLIDEFLPHVLPSSLSLVRYLHHSPLFKRTNTMFLFSLDIVSLYPSIPIPSAIEAIRFFLNKSKLPQTLKASILAALHIVLGNTFCVFLGDIYEQIRGLAMGNSVAVVVANIFLGYFELPFLTRYKQYLHFFFRYIDDATGLWSGPKATLLEFLSKFSIFCRSVKHTSEVSSTSTVFLDLKLSLSCVGNSLYTVEHEAYQKVLNAYLYVDASSFHPRGTARSFIVGELIRYLRNSSKEVSFLSVRRLFFERLIRRGYDPSFLSSIFSLFIFTDRDRFIFPPTTSTATTHAVGSFKVPYLQGTDFMRIARLFHECHSNSSEITKAILPSPPRVLFLKTSSLASLLCSSRLQELVNNQNPEI